MKKKTPLIKASKKRRIRLMLLSGRKLTQKYLNSVLDLTNSPELIRQLRKEMDIKTEWKISRQGTRYGEYSYVPPKKVSKIETRQYMNNF